MKNKLVLTSLTVLAIIASACASSTPTTTPNIPVTGSTPTALMMATPTGPAAVNMGQTAAMGSFLVDSTGMTLYIYSKDSPNTSTCTSTTCETNWPAFLTNGTPTAGTGVTASMLGTLTRADGSMQVTYNGWPLYHFAGDTTAGDTMGEGMLGFWSVISPAGMAVMMSATPTP